MEYKHAASSIYSAHLKRLIDIVFSACTLLFLSPILLLIAAAIKIDSPGPVFFRQKRVGKGKTYFNIYKFRTMRMNTPANLPTHKLSTPEKWITPVGKFLRKASLDELPQLFNILIGQMSIIGPRPALWNQFDLIAERDKYGANDVRPGLTGWAQINGRDELTIEEKASFDGEYAQNLCFTFDIYCFFGSVFPVLRGDGVIEGHDAKGNDAPGQNSAKDS